MKVICPDCSAVSKEELWNHATKLFWGSDSVPISVMLKNDKKNASEYWFVCPVCGERSNNGDKIVVIEDND